jgi:hypothetical protein
VLALVVPLLETNTCVFACTCRYATQIGLVLPFVSATALLGGVSIGPALDRWGLGFGIAMVLSTATGAFVTTW